MFEEGWKVNVCTVLFGKLQGKTAIGRLPDNIKMYFS
jgi:hypothetical protein